MILGVLWMLGAVSLGSTTTTTTATQEKSSSSGEAKPYGGVNDVILKYLSSKQDSLASTDNSHVAALENWKRAAHSLMHFGKRDDENDEHNDDKRASHNLMHFGKRGPAHSLMHFGKREDQDLEEDKRGSHNLMHFGKRPDGYADLAEYEKRGAHSLMHFGKRGHQMMHFGKRDEEQDGVEDKRAHQMMHFGKRDDEKRAHQMMHFGKRDEESDGQEDKRAHQMMHFGKRDEESDGQDDKRAHQMMHFGKRDEEPQSLEDKRAHQMMHFGKRDEESDGMEDKRAHQMMHFGKRDEESDGQEDKRAHQMMHFGKRDEESDGLEDKRAHQMMHFGKREEEEEKRAHAMMHFGKKSQPETYTERSQGPRRSARSVEPFFFDPYRSHYLFALVQKLNREDAKRGHNIMRFGKRQAGDSPYSQAWDTMLDDEEDDDIREGKRPDPRQHAMMHFGKRAVDLLSDGSAEEEDENDDNFDEDQYGYQDEEKRGANSYMHFGKRFDDRPTDSDLRQALEDYKRGHSLLHFGKRYPDSYQKRPQHTIMHFGKRSVDPASGGEDGKNLSQHARPRRSANQAAGVGARGDLRELLWRPAVETGYLLPHALTATELGTLHVPMFVGHLNRIQRAAYPYYNLPRTEKNKKEHRNLYLHFG